MRTLLSTVLVAVALLAASPAMAVVCTITEARVLPSDPAGKVLELISTSATTQMIDFTTDEDAATPLLDTTTHIRIACNGRAHFEIGTAPSATADNMMIPAAGVEYFFVPAGTARLIAFYDGTS